MSMTGSYEGVGNLVKNGVFDFSFGVQKSESLA
jgi:hypothetical protein